MGNNRKSINKTLALGVLASTGFCLSSQVVAEANTLSRSSSRVSSISRVSSVGSSISSVRRPMTSGTLTRLQLQDLNQRVLNIETEKIMESQRTKHPFNKAVMVSGVVSSAALVGGIVGGLIQQVKFRDLAERQSYKDQLVQEDLVQKRNEFEEKEIPEAEQYIIDYYKENFGIDITQ